MRFIIIIIVSAFVSTIVVVINTFDSLFDSFSDDEYRSRVSPSSIVLEERKKEDFCVGCRLLFLNKPPRLCARADSSSLFCGSFLETLTNLSIVYYYSRARARVCACMVNQQTPLQRLANGVSRQSRLGAETNKFTLAAFRTRSNLEFNERSFDKVGQSRSTVNDDDDDKWRWRRFIFLG